MTDIDDTSELIAQTQFHRIIPATVTLPDGAVVGDTNEEPAMLTVHADGWVTVHKLQQTTNMILTVLETQLTSHPNPATVSPLKTVAGTLKVHPGPGCACGSPIKRYWAPSPGLR